MTDIFNVQFLFWIHSKSLSQLLVLHLSVIYFDLQVVNVAGEVFNIPDVKETNKQIYQLHVQ